MEIAEPSTRVRLDLGYDGSAFSGWARQPGLRTVQGAIEEALAVLFQRAATAPTLVVAGRTDVGVHATGQVAHLDLQADHLAILNRVRPGHERATSGAASLTRRLNGLLGQDGDLRIDRAAVAPPGFDARFSALWRRYEYRVADEVSAHDPRRRTHTLWRQGRLDDAAMDDAARTLLGLHDFASFCKPREGATTIRTLQSFTWARDPDGVLVARLQADAFCHSMVRALVGACVAVGEERLGVAEPAELRDAARRTSAFVVMPAKGLTLVEVGYPDDAELAARAQQTRARRGLTDEGPVD